MPQFLSLLAFVLFSIQGFAATTKYPIHVFNGHKAGELTIESQAGGLFKTHYIFKDNGRGPEINEQFRLGKDGTFTEYSAKGTTTLGSVVDEKFTLKDGRAEWKTTSDKGDRAVKEPSLYIPINGSTVVASVAIAAVAQRKDNSLALLPTGKMTRKKLTEIKVKNEAGKEQTVQLFAHMGLSLSPMMFWATKGQNPRLFAWIEPGYLAMIEEGWSKNRALMEKTQQAAQAKMLVDTAQKLRHPVNGLLAIRNVRVFDSEKARLSEPSDVYVLKGKITSIVPTGSPEADVMNTLDGGGRVLLPGLFDMHGHMGKWDGPLHLAAGVTTVRDMGNDNDQMAQMLEQISTGQLLGPQIVPAGFLEGKSPFSAQMGFVVKDLAEAKHAVDWYSQHGYPQLKIYNSFPKEILKDIVAYAHLRGMRVSGHVPAFLRAEEVIEAGFDEIQHINQVLLNFLVTPTTDTRTLERFYLPAEKLADLDLDSSKVQDFISLMKKKGTTIDPTVSTFAFISQKDGEISEPYVAFADHLPANFQRDLKSAGMKIPDDATAVRYKKSYAKMIEFIGRMYKAGIPIVAGTDNIPGFVLHSELIAYVKAGLTPAQALQVATLNGAKYSRTPERGNLTIGKQADFALIDGNPVQDINDIRKVAAVMTNGHMVYPTEIYETLGVKPFVKDGPRVQPVAVKKKPHAKSESESTTR